LRNAQRKWTIQSALDHLGAAIGVMAFGHGEAAVKMAVAIERRRALWRRPLLLRV